MSANTRLALVILLTVPIVWIVGFGIGFGGAWAWTHIEQRWRRFRFIHSCVRCCRFTFVPMCRRCRKETSR